MRVRWRLWACARPPAAIAGMVFIAALRFAAIRGNLKLPVFSLPPEKGEQD